MRGKLWVLAILLATAALVPAAASAQVFTVGPGLGLAIPDNTYNGTTGTMLCNTINVPSGGGGGDTVDNLSVQIRMNHTFVGDLTIKLVGPTGIITTLVSRPGVIETADDGNDTAGFGENSNLANNNPLTYIQTATDESEVMGRTPVDLATGQTICLDGGTPCSYNPNRGAAVATQEDLSTAYDGTSKVGNWQLCIGDSAGADTGSLDGWTLNLFATTPVELIDAAVD
ncbi:MAG TPA: proprotein convertase P-domain-containing protein [Thermoanaerobaculia bacterium]|jgi:subtilisin-like proprotein convertase family protein|nr:proprotein convertase P-domain-containing protein [Thermoanaerobaculia bacterium]